MPIEYSFDPIDELGLDIPRNKRREALEVAAEFIRTEMLDYIGEGKSPVAGTPAKWAGLSKAYKEFKSGESSSAIANLELTGELLDSISFDSNSREVTITVADSQAAKAEGHLTGIYGDHMTGPPKPRKFMPLGDENFKRPILSKLKELLSEFED